MRSFRVLALLLLSPFTSNAADEQITGVPTNWILENSNGNTVNAYNTGTSCLSGRLRLHAGVTEEDKNRFWSTIMVAKVAGKSVTVWYDPDLDDCQLTRFRLN